MSTSDAFIATMDELVAIHAVVVAKEAADKQTLSPLITPTRESYRAQLFQWAANGFPGAYVVQSFSVIPPDVCSDGVKREIGKYIEYCIGSDLGVAIAKIKSMMSGIQPSWSTDGNMLRIHVTKI